MAHPGRGDRRRAGPVHRRASDRRADDPGYLAEIFTGLRATGLLVFHVLLDTSDDVLRHRIEASTGAREWRLGHLASYRRARPWLRDEADLVLDTAALTAVQAARQITRALPGVASARC